MKLYKNLLFTLLIFQFNLSISQEVPDPTKAKGVIPIPPGVDGRSQDVIAAEWLDNSYFTRYPYGTSTMMQLGESIKFEFIKDAEGKVTKIKAGLDEFPVSRPSGSDFIRLFYVHNLQVIYVSSKSIVRYHMNSEDEVTDIEYVAGKKMTFKAAKAEIEAYLKFGDLQIEADRNARIKAREEHRAKYSLIGKDVVSIEIIYPKGKPTFMDLNKVEIGLEATLADGTKIKTQNCGGQGYIEDYKFEFHNGTTTGISSEYSPSGYGNYYAGNPGVVGAFTDVKGKDIFSVTITSKHGGTGKLEVIFPLKYPINFTHTSNGQDGYQYPGNGKANGTAAGHGSPLTIYVKKVKHSESGIDLYLIKIVDGFTSNERIIKIDATGKLSVEVDGGTGGAGSPGKTKNRDDSGKPESGGNGGRGGNGGAIKLILDPSAKDFVLDYSNSAGSGGDAGRGGDCISCPFGSRGDAGYKGESGNSGTYSKEVKAVNI